MKQLKLSPLKGFNAFGYVFKKGRKISNNDALIVICNKEIDELIKKNNSYKDLNSILYGVTVPKKIAKKAVVRNRIKRLMRVSIIKYFQNLKIDYEIQIKYFIIVWRYAPKHPALINLDEVYPAIENLLNRYLKIT